MDTSVSFSSAFQGKYTVLIALIDIDHGLLPKLEDEDVLTAQHVADIEAENTTSKGVETLIRFLERRPNSDFKKFCNALRSTNQAHVVDKLNVPPQSAGSMTRSRSLRRRDAATGNGKRVAVENTYEPSRKKQRDELDQQSSYSDSTSQYLLSVLKQAYGDESTFRDDQLRAILLLVNKKRFAYIHAAGHGKSVVYLCAAKYLAKMHRKTTLVVLPLIALIRNQETTAKERFQLSTVCVDSETKSRGDWAEKKKRIARKKVDIIFTTPEQLSLAVLSRDDFIQNIGLLVIDECHCVSDLGQDFRPCYRRLTALIKRLPADVPILASSATVNPLEEQNIKSLLNLNEPTIRGPLQLVNISLHVLRLNFKKMYALAWLASYVPKFRGQGIIYCSTTADCEIVADWLQFKSVQARAYYSGVRPNTLICDRPNANVSDTELYGEQLKRQFDSNDFNILVTTSAYGMGYDNQNISFVILYKVPVSMAAIYQQIGRAGRGSKKSHAIVLFDNYGVEDNSLTPEDCELENYFANDKTLCDLEDVRRILAELPIQKKRKKSTDQEGITVDELCSTVNVKVETIEKTLTYLECGETAPVRSVNSNKWVRIGQLDRTEYSSCKSKVEEAKRAEWENKVFPFLAADSSCLMYQLTSALGDPSHYECNQCSYCESQRGSLSSYSCAKIEKRVTEAKIFVESSVRPLTLRRDLPVNAFKKYKYALNDDAFKIAKQGRVLSHWQDGCIGEILKKLTFDRRISQFDQHMSSLVNRAVTMYKDWKPSPSPLWVTYIPSVRHAHIPKHFSELFSQKTGLRFKEVFSVDESSKPLRQTLMKNDYFRCQNKDGAYKINADEIMKHDPVILIDYVVASGCTMSTFEALLRHEGSGPVFPLALTMRRRFLF